MAAQAAAEAATQSASVGMGQGVLAPSGQHQNGWHMNVSNAEKTLSCPACLEPMGSDARVMCRGNMHMMCGPCAAKVKDHSRCAVCREVSPPGGFVRVAAVANVIEAGTALLQEHKDAQAVRRMDAAFAQGIVELQHDPLVIETLRARVAHLEADLKSATESLRDASQKAALKQMVELQMCRVIEGLQHRTTAQGSRKRVCHSAAQTSRPLTLHEEIFGPADSDCD